MKYLWSLMLVLAGCSSKPNAQSCNSVAAEGRPKVTITWKIDPGSIDNDPPRPNVKIALSGGVKSEIDVGELEGQCKLAEVGLLPESPAPGSKVTELECVRGNRTMYATVFYLEPGKIVVRRYERVDESVKPARDLQVVETPTCATFVSEVVQGGEL